MIKLISFLLFLLLFIGCTNENTSDDDSSLSDSYPEQDAPVGDAFRTDFSDEELKTFFEISMQAQSVQEKYQQEMEDIADEEGIEAETYNRISQAFHSGQPIEEFEFSEEELEKFRLAYQRIAVVENEMEDEIIELVEERGMSLDVFEDINMAFHQDPEIQRKMQGLMQQYVEENPRDPYELEDF